MDQNSVIHNLISLEDDKIFALNDLMVRTGGHTSVCVFVGGGGVDGVWMCSQRASTCRWLVGVCVELFVCETKPGDVNRKTDLDARGHTCTLCGTWLVGEFDVGWQRHVTRNSSGLVSRMHLNDATTQVYFKSHTHGVCARDTDSSYHRSFVIHPCMYYITKL